MFPSSLQISWDYYILFFCSNKFTNYIHFKTTIKDSFSFVQKTSFLLVVTHRTFLLYISVVKIINRLLNICVLAKCKYLRKRVLILLSGNMFIYLNGNMT
jgi:hypothetical protein